MGRPRVAEVAAGQQFHSARLNMPARPDTAGFFPRAGAAQAWHNWRRHFSDFAQTHWRELTIAVPYLWLLVFFLVPFFIVLKISLAESLIASPPFSPLIEWAEGEALRIRIIFDNFAWLLEDELYVQTYLNSLKISTVSTVLCLLIATPSRTPSCARRPARGTFCCC